MRFDPNVAAADRMFDEDEYSEALTEVTERFIDAKIDISVVADVLNMLLDVHNKNSSLGATWQEDSVLSALDALKKGILTPDSKYRDEFDCRRLERQNERMTNYRQWCNSARVIIGEMKKSMWDGDHKKAGEHQMTLISMLEDEIDG